MHATSYRNYQSDHVIRMFGHCANRKVSFLLVDITSPWFHGFLVPPPHQEESGVPDFRTFFDGGGSQRIYSEIRFSQFEEAEKHSQGTP